MSKLIRKYSSSYLFGKSGFLTGCGSIFNISGNYFLFNYSKNGTEADLKALQNDWGLIGQDIKNAKKAFNNKKRL